MKYVSTSGRHTTDLRGAVAQCFAPDGTLYLPERIPVIPKAFFNNIAGMSMGEIAYAVVTSLLGDDVDAAVLKKIVDDTFVYNMPVRNIDSKTDLVELFHGPTLAYKDFSALFVANFLQQDASLDIPRVAMVATTGNTGAAVANAFARHRGRNVVILFPHGTLNRTQLSQFTTLGDTVHAVEVSGDIGRCKNLVREALSDTSLSALMRIVSVNTVNILRIIPQVVLLFYAYSRTVGEYGASRGEGFIPVIPCGNLSQLLSAVIAKRLGLPVRHIVAGCNANDDLVRVLRGQLTPDKVNSSSRPTLARAMDSGYPTNLNRILSLYGGNVGRAASEITAISVSDSEIQEIIKRYDTEHNILVDPHTAVAIGAWEKAEVDGNGVVFATAHPAKSLDTMTAITGKAVELPLQLTKFMARGKSPVKIPPTYSALRKFLLGAIK